MAAPAIDSSSAEADMEALVNRLFEATVGALDLLSIYIGDQLGLYDLLATESMTANQLAERAGCDARYIREWLEQQAATGLVVTADPSADADTRTYHLPDAAIEVLTNRESLAYLAPFGGLVAGVSLTVDQVVAAFRTGAGVPYEAYGTLARETIAAANKPTFMQQMASDWIPTMPDLLLRLQSDPAARVADIGCGAGWSSIAMAMAFPNVHVDGIDVDGPSIDDARRNAKEAGVADRVTFHLRDASAADASSPYDLVMAYECIHDMSNPVGALRMMRKMAGPAGTVLIADENAPDEFEAPADILSRFLYGVSVLHCLPVGRAEQPSAATGTVMRQETFRRYAEEAGFSAVDVLPIEHDFWRFYRLTP